MGKKLRLLNIVGSFLPAYGMGGPAQTTYHLCKAIIRAGHDVLVLTTDIDQKGRLDVPKGLTEWEGVPVRYCKLQRLPIPYHSTELILQLRSMIMQFDIVLINSSWTSYGALSGFECRSNLVPYVMYAHGSYAPERLKRSQLKKKIWWRLFDRSLYNHADAVVGLTEMEREQIRGMGIKTPVRIIPNGVDLTEITPIQHDQIEDLNYKQFLSKPFLLYLGRLEKVKGFDILIPAFAKISDKYPDLQLILAGPDEQGYETYIRKLIDEYKIANRVIFTGIAKGQNKAALFSNATAFVLPSYGEGMSVAILEAMAYGCPVVLSEQCGMPIIQESGAGYVSPLSVEEFAKRIQKILSNPEMSEQMKTNARKLVLSQYTWEAISERTIELCYEVLEGKELLFESGCVDHGIL